MHAQLVDDNGTVTALPAPEHELMVVLPVLRRGDEPPSHQAYIQVPYSVVQGLTGPIHRHETT